MVVLRERILFLKMTYAYMLVEKWFFYMILFHFPKSIEM